MPSSKAFPLHNMAGFGVPDPPQTLVRFVRAFRDRVPPEQDRVRPIVVHCSAGVGRSGTFIALDRILQQINRCDVVDIFGIVYNMRKERVSLDFSSLRIFEIENFTKGSP